MEVSKKIYKRKWNVIQDRKYVMKDKKRSQEETFEAYYKGLMNTMKYNERLEDP